MIRKCMTLVAFVTLCHLDAHAVDEEALKDPARYARDLRARGMLDATLQQQVRDVLAVLVASAGQWPRGEVNGDHDPRALNVYLVKGDVGLRGTLRAFPQQRIVLADAGYVAEIKAATEMYTESLVRRDRSVKMADTLASAMVEGPDQAVRSRLGPAADWREDTNGLFDGAVAFLLAHEMGHIHLGIAANSPGRPRLGLTGRDRDRAWACGTLVGEDVNRRREEERQADAYAVRLLGAIRHPSRAGLRYEYGTMFLQVAELGKVAAALAALSPNADQQARAAGFGVSPATRQAMAVTLGRTTGMVERAFPDSHPAQVQRLFDVVDAFSRIPMSECCRDLDTANHRSMWGMIVQATCGSIGAGGSR